MLLIRVLSIADLSVPAVQLLIMIIQKTLLLNVQEQLLIQII